MVAQSSANIPIFRGHARQHGRGFIALAQTLGRTAIHFIKKFLVPAAKKIWSRFIRNCCSRDWRGCQWTKKLETFAKHAGAKPVRKQLGGGKKKSKPRT